MGILSRFPSICASESLDIFLLTDHHELLQTLITLLLLTQFGKATPSASDLHLIHIELLNENKHCSARRINHLIQ